MCHEDWKISFGRFYFESLYRWSLILHETTSMLEAAFTEDDVQREGWYIREDKALG